MQHVIQPILNKAKVHGLAVHVARSGLCLNDPAELHITEEGRLEIHALIKRPFLGLIPRSSKLALGHLGPRATAVLVPHLEAETPLRLRIVGLTPEHIAAPEVFVSVWGALSPRYSGPPPLARNA